MAKRLISAAIAVPLGIFIIALNNVLLYVVLLSALSVVATYELLVATKYLQNKIMSVLSLTFVGMTPFLFSADYLLNIDFFNKNIKLIYFIFLVILFATMLFMHEKARFEQVALVAFISVCIPLAMSSIAFIRIKFPEHGHFFIVFTLISAWIGDAGAYFIGTFFGKHKMAPSISPKKTWEGFFGGVATSAIFGIMLGIGYEWIGSLMNNGQYLYHVNWIYLCVLAIICSVLGVVGDFSASLIKRECAVKDFGNILPGHGGVLDRFDSVLFVAPFVYMLFQVYNPIY